MPLKDTTLRLIVLGTALLAIAGCRDCPSEPLREIRAENRVAAEATYRSIFQQNNPAFTGYENSHLRARQVMLDIYGEYPKQVVQVPVEK